MNGSKVGVFKGRTALSFVLCASIAVAGVAYADDTDVYSNAYFWFRGMAADANGNGIYDKGEMSDALGGTWMQVGNAFGTSGIIYTNEVVDLPYRGVSRTMQTLYFPQTTVVTNANGWGYMDSSSFHIGGLLAKCMTDTAEDAHYAFAIRFRPDLTQPHTNYSWIVSVGHWSKTKRGMMIGFGPKFTRTITSGGATTKQTLARPYVFYGGNTWQPTGSTTTEPAATAPFFALGEWNDVVVSVSGRTVTLLVSRANSNAPINDSTRSASSKFMTTVKSFTVGSAYNLAPGDNGLVRFVSEGAEGARVAWDSTYTGTSYNAWKHFRGSIQSFAAWTNSLTVAQMREAAAWPRTDLWRVGVENDGVNEFHGGTGDVVVDMDRWNVPKTIAAGEGVTFKFTLDATGEAEMNEEFRLKATSDSSAANVRVSVNGTALGDKFVSSGGEQYWFVPAEKLLAGATNAITVTRTDSGAGAFKIDALALGGSLQYGKRDSSNFEFVREYDAPKTYDLIGGNWFDGRRIIFGQGASSGNLQYTNIVVNFSVPERQRNGYRWKLKWRFTGDGYTVMPVLNGKNLGSFASGATEQEVKLGEGNLQECNMLNIINMGSKSSYVAVDDLRLSLYEKRGLIISVR